MSGHALGPTHPHVQWVPGFLPGDEITGARVNLSSAASADANNGCSYTSALPICLQGVDRDSFTFHNDDGDDDDDDDNNNNNNN